MRHYQLLRYICCVLFVCCAWSISIEATAEGATSAAGPAPVELGTAGDFVILAKTGVSTTGDTSVVGNIGLSPAARSSITGFSDTLDSSNQFATSGLVVGKLYAADMAEPTPSNMTIAISDMEAAFTDAAGRAAPDYTGLGDGNIDGMTLTPGLYKWVTGVTIPTGVTLSGSTNDVWIFQIAGDLTVASDAMVTLSGGAQAKNIFWQVSGQTTLGTTSNFKGVILCQTLIALQTGASLNGRALAQTAVTLDANTVGLNYSLALTATEGGSVTKTLDQILYADGTEVLITAIPNEGYIFTRWVGDIPLGSETSTTATITMDSNKTIGATFTAVVHALNINIVGQGVVTKDPAGDSFTTGTVVALSATADAGWTFTGWSGDLTGSASPANITMDADKNVTATFTEITYTPDTPDNQLPSPGATEISLLPTLESSAFSDLDTGDTHAASQWQVRLASSGGDYATTVFDSGTDAVNLTAISLSPPLQQLTTYHWRVRYMDSQGTWSEWSNETSFKTVQSTPLLVTLVSLIATAQDYGQSVLVRWNTAEEYNNVGFNIYRAVPSGSGTFAKGDLLNLTVIPPKGSPTEGAVYEFVDVNPQQSGEDCWYYLEDIDLSGLRTLHGPVTLDADKTIYKVSYSKAAVTADEEGSLVVTGEAKGSLKVKLQKKTPRSVEPKEGKYFYLYLRTIPTVNIIGTMNKVAIDAPVVELKSSGVIKSLTTKNNIELVNAAGIGSLKMTVYLDGKTETAATTILTTGSGDMKLSLLGVILESLDTTQSMKYIKVGSKAWKNAAKAKVISLGGIGRIGSAADATVSTVNVSGGIQLISTKGCSIAPDTIVSGGTTVLSVSAKSAKMNGIQYDGFVGFADANPMLRIIAADMNNIYGYNGIAAVLIVGADANGTPTYSGGIKQIGAKNGVGVLVGEAHVSPTAKENTFKSDQGAFMVYTAPPTLYR